MMTITATGKKWGFETEQDITDYILESIEDGSVQTMEEAMNELNGYFEGSFEPEAIRQIQEALEEAEAIREEEEAEAARQEEYEAEEYRRDLAYMNAEYLRAVAVA